MNINRTMRVLALASLFALPSFSAGAAERSRWFDLQSPPTWISSVVWVPTLNRIAFVDPFQGRLAFYSPTGILSLPSDSNLLAKDNFLPALIVGEEANFALKLIGSGYKKLDKNMRQIGELDKLGNHRSKHGSVAPYSLAMADDYLVGFGSVDPGLVNGGEGVGFFKVRFAQSSGVDFFRPAKDAIKDADYYLIGHQLVATLGGDSYFVELPSGGEPAILRLAKDGKLKTMKLPVEIPRSFHTVRAIETAMASPETAAELFREIEGRSIITGIFPVQEGGDVFIYLMGRAPSNSGTSWSLFKITSDGRWVGSVEIPTNANHTTAVVSKDYWFFFEKGRVNASGTQDIKRMLRIPVAQIRNLKVTQ